MIEIKLMILEWLETPTSIYKINNLIKIDNFVDILDLHLNNKKFKIFVSKKMVMLKFIVSLSFKLIA
jgi:hypothetical protein